MVGELEVKNNNTTQLGDATQGKLNRAYTQLDWLHISQEVRQNTIYTINTYKYIYKNKHVHDEIQLIPYSARKETGQTKFKYT